MKVMIMAHGHPSLHKGGGEVAAYSLHRMLREHEHESVFVGWGGQPHTSSGGILAEVAEGDYLLFTQSEYFHFSSTSRNLIKGLEVLLQRHQPDVVHLHHYVHLGIEVAALIKRLAPQTRVVMTLHEYLAICANNGQLFTKNKDVCEGYRPERCHQCFPETSAASFFMREIAIKSALGYVDQFISPSKFLAEQYINWGIPYSRISVIENPLCVRNDLETHRLAAPKRGQRWKIGYFGQINFYKGLDIIVDAVKICADRGAMLEIGIHGTFSSVSGESYVDKLKYHINDLGDAAVYHGAYRQSEVQWLMQQYHWIVMGSRWYENSPVVIQEAISAGVPLIVPDHGGMKEKVGSAGLVYPPGSPHGLVQLLSRMGNDIYRQSLSAVDAVRAQQVGLNEQSFCTVLYVYDGKTLEAQ
jgi:glycosyltransferase involved in cell wall biosynthesis